MIYRRFEAGICRECGGKIFRTYKNPRILRFESVENNRLLKEEDFLNLFLGIIKLLKKSIRRDLEIEYKRKLGYYHEKIQKILSKINK